MKMFVEKIDRTLISFFIKISSLFIRLTGKGSGYTWPGRFIYNHFRSILKNSLPARKVILISGTNGKTTTAKIVVHLLSSLGYRVTSNSSGANLLSGIVSALFLDTDFFGNPRGDFAVLEVDEFALPEAVSLLSPTSVALLNLSRDQLDRYGEVDTITERWEKALSDPKLSFSLILNCEQPEFRKLEHLGKKEPLFFDSNEALLENTKLDGKFNALNVNAAVAVLSGLGFSREDVIPFLSDINVAYGRGEILLYNSKEYKIFLAKNPASLNHNLDLATKRKDSFDSVLFILNDNIPDGRDVSWIYDVDPEKLNAVCSGKEVFVAGTRSYDMAIRLQYAGCSVKIENIHDQLESALSSVSGDKVLVLPNYSAMLETRRVILGRKIL